MLSIRRVLWPTDFSTGAAQAFPHAAALAAWHDAALHVLHVQEGATSETSLPLSGDRLQELLAASGAPPAHVDLDAMTIVQEQEEGDAPPRAIAAYAEEQNIDVVVGGTHGRRGLQRLFIGSVAEEVLRTAPCPVFTVRSGETAVRAEAIHNILVPIDFSEASMEALHHARELALTYGAKITLLHAVEEVVYPSAYGIEPANMPGAQVVERVEDSLADLARSELGYEHVLVEANVGYAPSTILDYANNHDVDLITIATHGRTGLERMLLGSVAERVVRRAPVPVFAVKSFGKSLLPENGSDDV